MPIPLTMAFINKGPVPKGVCTRCAGYGDIKTQCMGGEVRFAKCSRCRRTGKEPVGFWAKFCTHFRQEVHP